MRRLPASALEKNNATTIRIVVLLIVGVLYYYLNQDAIASALARVSLPASHSSTGGLVGPAIDPGFGQSNLTGLLANFGYDTARDILRFCTALSAIIMITVALFRGRMAVRKIAASGTTRVRQILWIATRWGFLTVVVTLFVQLVGTFAINNYGGLCGGSGL